MKKGVSVWNYPGDAIENSRRFHSLGFDALSMTGPTFAKWDDAYLDQVAQMLTETGLYFTMHHLLPDPDDADMYTEYMRGIERMGRWQEKYKLLRGMTFDFWFEAKRILPYLAETMDVFRGQDMFFACEDTPLNTRTLDGFLKILKPGDQYGILLDVGHMNIRQRNMELYHPDDYVEAIAKLPLPILEVHLHDNKGRKDDHMYHGWGTLPLEAIVQGLRQKAFDGIVTVEIVQRDWSPEQGFQHAVNTRDAFLALWNP